MALTITAEQYATVQAYAAVGDYAGGWAYLTSIGDNYADNAYVVTTGDTAGVIDQGFHVLVEKHWANTAGANAYADKFDAVAKQHFQQYVEAIGDRGGALPTSEQIERSYREAVTDNGLPPETAFDGVFTNSMGDLADGFWPGPKENGLDWTDFLAMEDERQTESHVFDDLDKWDAWGTLLEDIWDTALELGNRGFNEAAQAWEQILDDAAKAFLEDAFNGIEDGANTFLNAAESHLSDLLDALGDEFVGWDPLGLMLDGETLPDFEQPEGKVSPLVVDLDGDGVETLALEEGVNFDHDGNGFAEKSGWVAPDDALLVRDLDGDGGIESGEELFGNHTRLQNGERAANGFEALAELDANGDGELDLSEAEELGIQLWQDANGDGVAQEDELLTLDEAGIAAIAVDYQDVTQGDGQGNVIRQLGQAFTAEGEERTAADVWFAVDRQDSREVETLALSDAVAALPNVPAFGNVRGLQQAMMRDEALEDLVTQFVAADSEAEREALIEPLIYQWTGAAGTDPDSRDEYGHVYMDARKVVALEALVGRGYDSGQGGNHVQGPQAASLLEEQFARFEAYVHGQLMARTEYRDIFDKIRLGVDWDGETFQTTLDASEFASALRELADGHRVYEVVDILEVLGDVGTYSSTLSEVAQTLESDVTLGRYFDLPVSRGSTDDDVLDGSTGDDWLIGMAGDDRLRSGQGNDVLDGGAGDDYLDGGTGNDTYRYAVGDGNDVIKDTAGDDALVFGAGITLDDLVVIRDSTALYLEVPASSQEASTGKIQIDRVFDVDGTVRESAIETFSFADGTQLTLGELLEAKRTHTATQAADLLDGTEADDVLHALGGDDFVSTGAGNDTLSGDEGNDTLYGGEGDDILIGGVGNDWLAGGHGSDTYRFVMGWGSDTVLDYTPDDVDASDTIVFGEGISPSEIDTLHFDGTLVLQRRNSNDTIGVKRYFGDGGSSDYPIESILFSDGTEWSVSDVKTKYLSTYPSDGDDTIFGFASPDVIDGRSGDDTLFGYDGDDTLRGDGGDDTLFGGNGADSLLGGLGSDTLFGEEGDDTLHGDDGDDTLFGGNGADRLLGGLGSDTLFGGEGVDILHGNAGSDRLFGDSGDDSLLGGDGDDELYGGDGDDTLDGGEGSDNLYGGGGNDELIGGKGDDGLDGGNGDDTLDGGVGNDELQGGSGKNELIGGEGNDSLYSGGDDDTLDGGSGSDELYAGGGDDVLLGGLGDDQLYGGDGSDTLKGDEGNDFFFAGNGDDTLWGGAGDDQLIGGSGSDHLYGGDGNDILYGGGGDDVLQGGAGSDTYRFARSDGSVHIDNGTDNSADALDALIFGNVEPDEVTLTRDIDDLVFGIIDSNDSVTVSNWFQSEAHRLDRIEIDDALLMGDSLGELDSTVRILGVNDDGELALV